MTDTYYYSRRATAIDIVHEERKKDRNGSLEKKKGNEGKCWVLNI